jgi:hypothetical protein
VTIASHFVGAAPIAHRVRGCRRLRVRNRTGSGLTNVCRRVQHNS